MSHDNSVLYVRELPGGGFVSIEGAPAVDGVPFHGTLLVERRSDPDRRDGHEPPAVLAVNGPSQREVFEQLVAVANSNVAVAAALLRWQGGREGRPTAVGDG